MKNNNMKPDAFLFGASKCGTSALASYLREHQGVCFSEPKEPNYFNTDFYPATYNSHDAYLRTVFAGCEKELLWIEGSVRYIYSADAAKNILAVNPAAKFIVLVRDPIDMFVSWYHQRYATEKEWHKTLEKAWRGQFSINDKDKLTADQRLNQYGPFCKLGEQLERLYKAVPKEQVLVLLYDDLKKNPHQIYIDTLRFLGLEDDGRTHFPVVNKSRATSTKWLHKLIRRYRKIKKRLGIRRGVGNTRLVQKLFFGKKQTMPLSLKRELQEYYKEDVALLESLINRDLSHWLR